MSEGEIEAQLIFQTKKSDELEKELVQAKLLLDKYNFDKQSNVKSDHKTVFISREKKLSKLGGRPIKDSDPDVTEWLEDAEQHLKTIDSVDSQIEFLLDNIGGQCKDEVRLRSPEERNTPTKILKIIKDVFTGVESLAALQQEFYQRDQKDGESLQNYSLTLMKLLERILQKDKTAIKDKDVILKDRFVDGVNDIILRRELKMSLWQNSKMSFCEFRQMVLNWSEDYMKQKSYQSQSQIAEISKKKSTNAGELEETSC